MFDDPLMTTDEVAAYTRLPIATVRWLRHAHRGPAASVLGRRVVYRRSDVDAWIKSKHDAEPVGNAVNDRKMTTSCPDA